MKSSAALNLERFNDLPDSQAGRKANTAPSAAPQRADAAAAPRAPGSVQVQAEPEVPAAPAAPAPVIETVRVDDLPRRLNPHEGVRNYHHEQPKPHLVPALLADLGNNFFTYFLMAVLCALALVKVYQVQETRMVTAQLNEVRETNADLQRRWLALTSERQTLSEHGRVRQAAMTQLQMRAPKTEAELMITVR